MNHTVRISGARRAFDKGYRGNWTNELIKVSVRFPTDPPTYGLVDQAGEDIKGKFYAEELQKVKSKEIYNIERVIKSRKRGER